MQKLSKRFKIFVREKVIGKMKDEVKGNMISEFVELKSKMYSLIAEKKKKVKGVNKNVAENRRQREYVDFLFDKTSIRHKMKIIQSKLHRTGMYDVFKIHLSCFDDKRHILDEGINSLTYFHKSIKR